MASRHGSVSPSVSSDVDEGDMRINMPELGSLMTALKMGTTMTKLPSRQSKGRLEQKTFQLNVDEFRISWFRGAGGKEEGSSKPCRSLAFQTYCSLCFCPSNIVFITPYIDHK